MQKRQFLALLLVLKVMVIAFVNPPGTVSISVPLKVVRSGLQNLGESKSLEAIWISNENQWTDLVDRVSRTTVVLPQRISPPEIDFAKYGILLVRMGRMPTGGYRLELMANVAEPEWGLVGLVVFPLDGGGGRAGVGVGGGVKPPPRSADDHLLWSHAARRGNRCTDGGHALPRW